MQIREKSPLTHAAHEKYQYIKENLYGTQIKMHVKYSLFCPNPLGLQVIWDKFTKHLY